MKQTQLLVIGAGPYALSAAALARERGIDTVVLGQPMGFWRENMPADMFLRSGPDWHLDGAGRHTFQAYLEERAIKPDEIDPIPVSVFLDYADWFRKAKGIEVREEFVGTAGQGGRAVRGTLARRGRHPGGRRGGGPGNPALREPPRLGAGVARRIAPRTPATWCALTTWPERVS